MKKLQIILTLTLSGVFFAANAATYYTCPEKVNCSTNNPESCKAANGDNHLTLINYASSSASLTKGTYFFKYAKTSWSTETRGLCFYKQADDGALIFAISLQSLLGPSGKKWQGIPGMWACEGSVNQCKFLQVQKNKEP